MLAKHFEPGLALVVTLGDVQGEIMRNVLVVVALSLSVLAACAVRMVKDMNLLTTEPIYLRHQKTGQIVQCGPDYGAAVEASAIPMRELTCINDYKLQGFVRIPKPGK